jgi:hypothetical protein
MVRGELLYSLQSYYPTSQLIFFSYLLVYLLYNEFGPSCVYHTFGHKISYDLIPLRFWIPKPH